ncbi:hypothetical protein Tco_0769659 [Tanacetum coccineum]|uniref:Uncharacterized protein n=1 Tax=Tanacetum coccineum TaxID=301880 RepID=A0ABQ4ZDX0_9ASTR
MDSPPNHEWEEGLDIDNSDLRLTPPIRIIPGPAGIVQTAKLRKLVDTLEGGEESVMSTQEYIRKVIEDVGEDDDFTRAPWLSAIDYVNVDGGVVTGCFGPKSVAVFHHVSTENGQDIFMLVEKYYPLTKGLTTLMLSNKLRVDQQSEMADEILTKIYNIANKPKK